MIKEVGIRAATPGSSCEGSDCVNSPAIPHPALPCVCSLASRRMHHLGHQRHFVRRVSWSQSLPTGPPVPGMLEHGGHGERPRSGAGSVTQSRCRHRPMNFGLYRTNLPCFDSTYRREPSKYTQAQHRARDSCEKADGCIARYLLQIERNIVRL